MSINTKVRRIMRHKFGELFAIDDEYKLWLLLKAISSMSSALHCVYLHRNVDPVLGDAIAKWQRASGVLYKLMKEPRHLVGGVEWVDSALINEVTEAYLYMVAAVEGSIAGRAERWANRKIKEIEEEEKEKAEEDAP